MLIEYDGTGYLGWQVQPAGPTVQEAIERALRAITVEAGRVVGAGRTDAGVHAEGQVAHFTTRGAMPARRMFLALNAVLPRDIAVLRLDEAADDFHARNDACGRRYRYAVLNREARPALLRFRALHVPRPLDLEAMREAARHCVGAHDFSSFGCNAGRDDDPVRTVLDAAVERRGDLVLIEIEAVSFLYKMVRSIAGTLIDVGRGKLAPDDFRRILEARDRAAARPTAAARGLCLVRVRYPGEGT